MAKKGIPLSKEHKRKISEARKREWASGLRVGGWKLSQETKHKHSLCKLGDKNPAKRPEVREKIRQTLKEKMYMAGQEIHNWKGEEAGRNPKHQWVKRYKGTPDNCELCGTPRNNRRFDWANKDHSYKRNLEDYMWVCRSCHRKWDIKYNGYLIKANTN